MNKGYFFIMGYLTKQKVLLILMLEDDINIFRTILESDNYEVFAIRNGELAARIAYEYQPDLIICQSEMIEINGFQVFSHLKKRLLKKGIAFFLYTNTFNKEDILIGLEMGMDNFIISPVDPVVLINKVRNHIQKINESRLFDKTRLEFYFESTPVAKFVIRNSRIERVNKAFCQLLNFQQDSNELPLVNEIFSFTNNYNDTLCFRKCLNGLIPNCLLKNIESVYNPGDFFDIHFCNFDSLDQGRILADVIPSNISMEGCSHQSVDFSKNANSDDADVGELLVVFTTREQEILTLSARGLPIKQIASILNVSNRTVEKHRANIMKKTESNNIIEAIVFAHTNNLLQPEPEFERT